MDGTRILLVSDDQRVITVLKAVAEARERTEVVVCDTVEELSPAVDATHPDLLVLDLDNGKADPLRLLEILDDKRCTSPVVLTGSCGSRTVAAAQRVAVLRQLTVREPLAKPLDADALQQVLLAAVRPEQVPVGADELAAAIENDEFSLHYQPLVNLHTDAVHSAEALLRWQHPHYGWVSPERVIPLAEEFGLIAPLTHWVVRTALTQYRTWQDAGWDFKIAVNVSASVLRESGFADSVADQCQRAGVPTSRLVLELTESQTITEEVEVLEMLTRLRLRHIELAIDDFGTGYSSLGRLHRMPFSEIKIDKSFVMDAASNLDGDAEAIVDIISDLGRRFGMTVVAEGVSNREAWDLVSRLKCDVAQGYFVSKPIAADAFTTWLERWGSPLRVGGVQAKHAVDVDSAPPGAKLPAGPVANRG